MLDLKTQTKIVVLTDIHSNQYALRAVLDDVYSIANDHKIVFLGDLFGYGPTPVQAYEKLKSLDPAVWLAGNHDLALSQDSKIFHDMQVRSQQCIEKNSSVLDSGTRSRAMNQPVKLVNSQFLFSHGFPLVDDSKSVKTYDTHYHPQQFSEFILELWRQEYPDTHVWFVGHSHIQRVWCYSQREKAWRLFPIEKGDEVYKKTEMIQENNGRISYRVSVPVERVDEDLIMFNPGSVGLPRDGGLDVKSGNILAKYGLIYSEDGQMIFEQISVPYPREPLYHDWQHHGYPVEWLIGILETRES
jgi:predicted phosphodiesterase